MNLIQSGDFFLSEHQGKKMICQRLKSGIMLSIGIFVIICGSLSGPANAGTQCPTHIWIDCGEQTREKNGAVTQRYYIRNSDDICRNCTQPPDYKAFYRLKSSTPKKPYRFDRSFPEADYSCALIRCDNGELYMDITSETNSHVQLYVYGTCGRKKLSAQITHPLFGKAPSEKKRTQEPVARLPEGFPTLNLHAAPRNFYMQTGQTYQFTYAGKGTTVSTMSILENHKQLAKVAVSPGGIFAYTPPHDPQLDRNGPNEVKETVALVEETTPQWDFATTHTLLLHRSYLAHLRLLPGLALFGVTILLFAAIVGYKRKNGAADGY